jgi:hypothetical protein
MEERYSTKKLIGLRKLTRAIADFLRGQMKEHISTFSYLFRPRTVLGEFVQSGTQETIPGSDKAFKELQALYEAVAGAKPFNLPKELKAPVEIISPVVETSPVEYAHLARTQGQAKKITITSPLKWVLNYTGYTPRRLWALMADPARTEEQVREYVVHSLVMSVVVARQPGMLKILNALHFPIQSARREELYGLPTPYVMCAVRTQLPPDELIIESTEVSGMNAFEEVVNLEDIVNLRHPLKDQLVELVKSHGVDIPPQEHQAPPP